MTNQSAPYEGGCLCGAIRYRFTGAPLSSTNCFCRSCRLASGATPVAWVVAQRQHFQWLQGEPTRFLSSPGVTRGFCGRCGSPLSYEHAQYPAEIELTTATLDAPERCAPTREIWHADRVRWVPSDPQLAHHPRGSSEPPMPKVVPHPAGSAPGALHHLSFGVADLALAGRFYDAALAPLGLRRVFEDDEAIGYGLEDDEDLLCLKQRPAAAAPGPGFHLAFHAETRQAVDAFHAAALAHGGRDNGPPGLRPDYGDSYYAAFVIDPTGHAIEAVCKAPG